ncbi:Fatty acid hydroxylase [Mycena indigotica]|uniref:Fatty acid hydroxylase n=1 Tax=Mycena indigotica TaxID=2126181 RepID=A0A8H6SEG9_9AGAR|nr:Fatty acid hydroxylase [Mycena indigotica]KAF7297285.1 Fatty acid hydroxylase [Mycena indigotica]
MSSFSSNIASAVEEWNRSQAWDNIRASTTRDAALEQTQDTSPTSIHHFPNELLETFFALAITPPTLSEPPEGEPQITSPTTFLHVCRRWRHVALETGRLWTSVILTFPTSTAQVTRMLHWLQRSQTCALDILFDFRDPDWVVIDEEDEHEFTAADIDAVLNIPLVRESVYRWRSLELLVDTWHPMLSFLQHTQQFGQDMTNLETLRLARCNAYFACHEQPFQPATLNISLPLFGPNFTSCHLREVSFVGVHVDWELAELSLIGLTSLELKYQAQDVMPTIPSLARILRGNPLLEKLSIMGHVPQGQSNVNKEPILHLPHVSEFIFGFVDVELGINFMQTFSFPALRVLTLENVGISLRDEDAENSESFFVWLCRSPSTLNLPSITNLALISIHISSTLFDSLFRSLPQLRVLHLSGLVPDGHQCALSVIRTQNLARLHSVIVKQNASSPLSMHTSFDLETSD